MKKTLLILSVLSIIAFSCKNENKEENNLLGKWKNTKVDTVDYVLKISENHEWEYFKNKELLEEGTFEIKGNTFIMKHTIKDHDHAHKGQDHSHKHPKDHVYEFSLNEDKTELSFISDEKTSTFKKFN